MILPPVSRYAATTARGSCHCHHSIPFDVVQPLPADQCEAPCFVGDPNQFCGGGDEDTLLFHVATCPEGETRFGDNCYVEGEERLTVEEAYDFCRDKVCRLRIYS